MDASRVVDERLRKRAAFATSAGHAVCSVLVAVANFQAEPWRTAAVLLPSPLFSLLMVCISPAASDSDLGTPTLERPMLNVSISSAVASMGTFFAAARHRWHPIDSLHGLIMSLTHFCVPCLGVCNARWFWPAHRAALTVSGALHIARVIAQTHDLLLAKTASIEQCHTLSRPAAIAFGCVLMTMGLALTPSIRTWLATRFGSFGLPGARVLQLKDGILLPPENDQPSTTWCSNASRSRSRRSRCSVGASSGLFAGKEPSLWSGWSASWSDCGKSSSAKLSLMLTQAGGPMPLMGDVRVEFEPTKSRSGY